MQIEAPPEKKQATQAAAGEEGGGGSASGSIREGYGNIVPLSTIDTFYITRKNVIRQTFIRSKIHVVDFVITNKPVTFPYDLLQFYFEDNTNSFNRFKGLCNISWGIQFDFAGFSVRNYSVVRKALLSASSTSVYTYNTAPDVNLVFATERNKVKSYAINERERQENAPYIRQNTADLDDITLTHEECPSKHVWHRTVHISRPDNFLFEVPILQPHLKDMALYTLPIYNGSLSVSNLNEARWAGVQTAKADALSIEKSCMVIKDGFTPNPYTLMGVYKLPDDTGFMKYIVRIELTSRLDVTFHLDSDYESNADLERFRKHLPWKKKVIKEKSIVKDYVIDCFPANRMPTTI